MCRILFAITFLLCACGEITKEKDKNAEVVNSSGLKYARRFSISNEKDVVKVFLFGNRNNFDTTDVFVLSKKNRSVGVANNISIPCKKIAALSCIYSTMLTELGAADDIAAIDNIDYVNNLEIIKRFNSGQIKQIATGPELDLEATIQMKPDVVFTFGMGNAAGNNISRLRSAGIPVAISLDHLEESPLARAEWIKFFAAFVDKSQQADSIFNAVEKRYQEVHKLAATVKEKPSVFSEAKFGDVWYMPGGRSFMATLINDAGGNYLWKDNQETGSLPLSFEQVFARANAADFWINPPLIYKKEELLSADKRYAAFIAFQNDHIYNNTKVRNAKGYSNYWETGMIHPDRILSDLTLIFHPELKSQLMDELYYYEQLH